HAILVFRVERHEPLRLAIRVPAVRGTKEHHRRPPGLWLRVPEMVTPNGEAVARVVREAQPRREREMIGAAGDRRSHERRDHDVPDDPCFNTCQPGAPACLYPARARVGLMCSFVVQSPGDSMWSAFGSAPGPGIRVGEHLALPRSRSRTSGPLAANLPAGNAGFDTPRGPPAPAVS